MKLSYSTRGWYFLPASELLGAAAEMRFSGMKRDERNRDVIRFADSNDLLHIICSILILLLNCSIAFHTQKRQDGSGGHMKISRPCPLF